MAADSLGTKKIENHEHAHTENSKRAYEHTRERICMANFAFIFMLLCSRFGLAMLFTGLSCPKKVIRN